MSQAKPEPSTCPCAHLRIEHPRAGRCQHLDTDGRRCDCPVFQGTLIRRF
jgi:hypothetical protein